MEEYTEWSPAAGATVDDLCLATATVQAGATGSQTALVKEELRNAIQNKRRLRGQQDAVATYNKLGPESLTNRDIKRQANRRASNRRAANKSRMKKKAREHKNEEEMAKLRSDNKQLKIIVNELTEMLTNKECLTCALMKAPDLLLTAITEDLLDDTA